MYVERRTEISTKKYAKIRIIEVKGELREGIPHAECTFEWVFQSDGSTTFPK